jgi:hypothetical protein
MRSPRASKATKDRIRIAEARLRLEVETFVLACSKGETPPNPIFLEPYFERYALTVLKETAASLLRGMASPESASVVQQQADALIDKICGHDGLWRQVVEESFDKTNKIHFGNSSIGYHPASEFIRPRPRALKEALRLQVLRWQMEALERQPTDDQHGNRKARVQTVAVPKAHSAVRESRQPAAPPANRVSAVEDRLIADKSARRATAIRRTPHPDPESILSKYPLGVNKATAANIFGISTRRVEQLIKDGELEATGRGHVKRVTTESVRARLNAKNSRTNAK